MSKCKTELPNDVEKVAKAVGPSTAAIHGHDPDLWSWKPTILPIVMSSNFKYDILDKLEEEEGYYYTRCGNPTRDCLEKTFAKLENAKHSLCFSSGMSTLATVSMLLKPGDHVICSNIVYGGTSHYYNEFAKKWNMEVTYVDPSNPSNIVKAVKSNTKLVWLEVLTNPTLQLVDIKSIVQDLKKHKGIIFAVDNTFLTPCLAKLLDFGVDIVMNSVTKYLNGHGDVLMGVLSTSNQVIYERCLDIQKSLGSVPSPFDCYLVNRSLKTLRIRMKGHCDNARIVADFLATHPSIETVTYPGLKSYPQHQLAKKTISDFGGMIAFHLKKESSCTARETTMKFLKKLKVIIFSASLGMMESIICFPWTTSHAQLSSEEKEAIGITETFLRLSVGLEDVEDIVEDLRQALS